MYLQRRFNNFKPGRRRPCAWFLEIVPVQTFLCVCLCVCPPLRLLITSSEIWTPYDWLNKFYSRYMEIVVVIVNGHGIGIERVIATNPLRVS